MVADYRHEHTFLLRSILLQVSSDQYIYRYCCGCGPLILNLGIIVIIDPGTRLFFPVNGTVKLIVAYAVGMLFITQFSGSQCRCVVYLIVGLLFFGAILFTLLFKIWQGCLPYSCVIYLRRLDVSCCRLTITDYNAQRSHSPILRIVYYNIE